MIYITLLVKLILSFLHDLFSQHDNIAHGLSLEIVHVTAPIFWVDVKHILHIIIKHQKKKKNIKQKFWKIKKKEE